MTDHEYKPPNMPPMHGMFQMVIAVYDRKRGWLTTKRSIIYGGRHGKPPMIDLEVEEIMEIMTPELRSGIRACKHTWEKG